MKNIMIMILFALYVISGAKAASYQDYHFVFIGGLNNEMVPAYFRNAEVVLKQQGASCINRFMPASRHTVLENVSHLRSSLLSLYQRCDRRPLIIVAHSKGGLELFHTLGRSLSDFFPSIVHKAVFSNTPFQGSPYMKVAIEEMERSIFAGTFYHQALLHGMRSLETTAIKSNINATLESLQPSQIKELSRKMYYVRTSQVAGKVTRSLVKSAQYLASSGANDGLIPLTNQFIPEMGSDVMVFTETDHTDLFVSIDEKQRPKLQALFAHLLGEL